MPKISVIIPVYNAENYLARCLDSVCNQTLKDIEIICIDDCSKDNSLNILNEYAQKDSRIKVIKHKINGGESKARNTGLENANGEYLAFVDNDDTIDLNFYEKLYNKASETNADIVKGEAHIFDYDGKEKFDGLNKKIRKNASKLYFSSYWWCAIFKRELVTKNNINFIENYPLGGDVLFLNKIIILANKLELVDDIYYNYYKREDSGDSKVLNFEKIKSVLEIHEMIIDNIIESKIDDKIGIGYINTWSLNNALFYAFRNKTVEGLKFCINKAFNFYKKTKNDLDKSSLNVLPIVMNYLENNDKDGLLEFYLKNDSQQKMFIANLRYLHSNKVAK